MSKRKIVAASASLVVVTALLSSACSAQADGSRDLPPGVVTHRPSPGDLDPTPIPFEGPYAEWIEPGKSFRYVSFGSSSCPHAVKTWNVNDSHIAIELELPYAEGVACTADYGPMNHEFSLEGKALTYPAEIQVSMYGEQVGELLFLPTP